MSKSVIFGILLMLFLIFPANARDYFKDKYDYKNDGLYFFSEELNLDKYYPRFNMKAKGIDVSKWQGDIDWKRVREAGIEFVIIREGYSRQIDRNFHKNIRGAQTNNLKCGVYHFSCASNENEAIAEADFCLENIKGYKLEYPIIFDIENDKITYLGKQKITNICKAFCNRIKERGYYPAVYINLNWLKNYVDNSILAYYDLWFARYNKNGAGHLCGMWQYTSSGRVNGINGDVDCDIAYFDYPQIIKELHLNGF